LVYIQAAEAARAWLDWLTAQIEAISSGLRAGYRKVARSDKHANVVVTRNRL
jgi:hypothetical protein